jgi:hypothetical protein
MTVIISTTTVQPIPPFKRPALPEHPATSTRRKSLDLSLSSTSTSSGTPPLGDQFRARRSSLPAQAPLPTAQPTLALSTPAQVTPVPSPTVRSIPDIVRDVERLLRELTEHPSRPVRPTQTRRQPPASTLPPPPAFLPARPAFSYKDALLKPPTPPQPPRKKGLTPLNRRRQQPSPTAWNQPPPVPHHSRPGQLPRDRSARHHALPRDLINAHLPLLSRKQLIEILRDVLFQRDSTPDFSGAPQFGSYRPTSTAVNSNYTASFFGPAGNRHAYHSVSEPNHYRPHPYSYPSQRDAFLSSSHRSARRSRGGRGRGRA